MSQTAFDVPSGGEPPKLALTLFTPEEFERFWPELEKMMDTVPHTWRHWTKESVCLAVAQGTIQVWGIGKPPEATLIVFTMINVYPALRVLSVVWAAGHLEEGMVPLLNATFENYGVMNGCTEIEIRGRPGWGPGLKKLGYSTPVRVWTRVFRGGRLN